MAIQNRNDRIRQAQSARCARVESMPPHNECRISSVLMLGKNEVCGRLQVVPADL